MSTATKHPFLAGQRVKVTRCTPSAVEGRVGVLTREYEGDRAYVKLEDDYDGPHANGEWVIDEWEPLDGVESVTRDNVVGMTLIAKYVPGFPEHHGTEFVVTEVHDDTTTNWTRGLCVKGHFPIPGSVSTDALWVHEWDVPGLDEHALALKAKDDEIAKLTKLLDEERDRLREKQRHYVHDLSAINRLANAEADQQDWCSTYEDTLDSMNSVLIGGFVLTGREFEWNVDAYEEVTVRVRRSWSGTARNEDAAKEAAGEFFDENDVTDEEVIDALREYADPSFSGRDDSYLWTVEKV